MALIKSLKDRSPKISKNVYLSDTAVIIGDVSIGEQSSIWFNAVVRGDVNSIYIGKKVNIQDGVVIHGTYKKHHTVIKDRVSIGHNAIVHGSIIESDVLIGMGSIILDNCLIKPNSIIAAGSVLRKNTIVKEHEIYAGNPAVKVKKVSIHQVKELINKTTNNYIKYSSWFKKA